MGVAILEQRLTTCEMSRLRQSWQIAGRGKRGDMKISPVFDQLRFSDFASLA